MPIEDSLSALQSSRQAVANLLLSTAMKGMLESSPDPIFIVDRHGCYLAVGQAGALALGLPASEIVGRAAREFGLTTEVAAGLAAETERVFATKISHIGTALILTVAGLRRYEHHFTPLLDDRGEVTAMLCVARDVNALIEHEAAQEKIRASEEHFRAMVDAIPQLAWTAHADGFIYWYNRRWYEYTGTTPQAMEGWGWQSVHDPETLSAVLEQWQASIATGEPFDMVFPLRGADGKFRPFLTRVQPLKDAEGQVTQWFGSNTDVEELKRAEEGLRERQVEIENLNQRLRRAMIETHHRVKNNLQLVSALIDLQSQSGQEMVPVSEMVRLGQNIQVLGVIHDILTREAKVDGDASVVSAKEVLEKLLPLLQSTLGARRLLSRLAELALPSKQTTSLALIANELISNAVKHGTGDIELVLRLESGEAILEVCDDGPGFVQGFDPHTAAHTGLELIENVARYDLQAETSYENRLEGGARVLLRFAIRNPSLYLFKSLEQMQ